MTGLPILHLVVKVKAPSVVKKSADDVPFAFPKGADCSCLESLPFTRHSRALPLFAENGTGMKSKTRYEKRNQCARLTLVDSALLGTPI